MKSLQISPCVSASPLQIKPVKLQIWFGEGLSIWEKSYCSKSSSSSVTGDPRNILSHCLKLHRAGGFFGDVEALNSPTHFSKKESSKTSGFCKAAPWCRQASTGEKAQRTQIQHTHYSLMGSGAILLGLVLSEGTKAAHPEGLPVTWVGLTKPDLETMSPGHHIRWELSVGTSTSQQDLR